MLPLLQCLLGKLVGLEVNLIGGDEFHNVILGQQLGFALHLLCDIVLVRFYGCDCELLLRLGRLRFWRLMHHRHRL
jgi:hypothetical protein